MTMHRLRKNQQPAPGGRICGHANRRGAVCGKFHGHRGPHLYPKVSAGQKALAMDELRRTVAQVAATREPAPTRADSMVPAPYTLTLKRPVWIPQAIADLVAKGKVATWATMVGPEAAAAWLERNTDNRPLRQSVVDRYTRLMRDGRWKVTHEGVAFCTDGTLLDGQHRLWAILGLPEDQFIPLLVTFNLPRDSRMAMDAGLARNAADAVTLDAGRGRWTTREIATLRAMIRGTQGTRTELTAVELPEWLDKYGEAVRFANQHLPVKRGLICEVRAAVARAYLHVDHAKLERFCTVLNHGLAESPAEHSAVLLRNYLARMAGAPSESVRAIYHKTEKAIRSFVDGGVVQKLQVDRGALARNDSTPEIFPLNP